MQHDRPSLVNTATLPEWAYSRSNAVSQTSNRAGEQYINRHSVRQSEQAPQAYQNPCGAAILSANGERYWPSG